MITRKYKQVKEKKITFDMKQWAEVERRADACHTDTTKYLRKIILEKEPIFYDMKEAAPLLNGMRIISNNIKQVARKANETNSIYAGDIKKIKEKQSELCRLLNTFVSTITPSGR
jgi:hypothetical protein